VTLFKISRSVSLFVNVAYATVLKGAMKAPVHRLIETPGLNFHGGEL
jgi:hypothetical protein